MTTHSLVITVSHHVIILSNCANPIICDLLCHQWTLLALTLNNCAIMLSNWVMMEDNYIITVSYCAVSGPYWEITISSCSIKIWLYHHCVLLKHHNSPLFHLCGQFNIILCYCVITIHYYIIPVCDLLSFPMVFYAISGPYLVITSLCSIVSSCALMTHHYSLFCHHYGNRMNI